MSPRRLQRSVTSGNVAGVQAQGAFAESDVNGMLFSPTAIRRVPRELRRRAAAWLELIAALRAGRPARAPTNVPAHSTVASLYTNSQEGFNSKPQPLAAF